MNMRVLAVSCLVLATTTASAARAAGRVPQQFTSSSDVYILPMPLDQGICFLSGLAGPGGAEVRPSGLPPPDQGEGWGLWASGGATPTATCYAWSDFSNLLAQGLHWGWALLSRSSTFASDNHPGDLCQLSALNHFTDGDSYRLVYDTGSKAWVAAIDGRVSSQAVANGQCWWLGGQVQDPMRILDWAGTNETTLPAPRADEHICVLSGIFGSTAAGAAKLQITDGRWHLHIEGSVRGAEALCFPLDLSGCHSRDITGDTHVCPTLVSGFIDEVDPYCASGEWDWYCVHEATCADSICAAVPSCCGDAWNGDCRALYSVLCVDPL